jgi:hypothetical protein
MVKRYARVASFLPLPAPGFIASSCMIAVAVL